MPLCPPSRPPNRAWSVRWIKLPARAKAAKATVAGATVTAAATAASVRRRTEPQVAAARVENAGMPVVPEAQVPMAEVAACSLDPTSRRR